MDKKRPLSEILAEIAAKGQPPKQRKHRVRKRSAKKKKPKPMAPDNVLVTPILRATFTSEQKLDLFQKAWYGAGQKKQLWWRLFLLAANPDISDLACRLEIPREQLEKEYKLYLIERGEFP